MAKGNSIIVTPAPMGRKQEGFIRTAEKPGTVVQLDVSEKFDANNRPDFEPYDAAADGDQRVIIVLLEDELQGRNQTTAYAAGDACFVYYPLPGNELNMIIEDIAGTGDDHSWGDIMIVNDGTGKLIATTGSPESEPFIVLEDITDPTADTLAHCLFTGY